MHALTMIFLAIMPLGAAFFNFIVPLQIGARDVAFPRLNALSYWLFLFGALLLNSSFFFGGAPDAGWFSYANLTANEYSPTNAIDFFSLGMLVLGVSSIAAALNFIITIFNLRAPGMTLMRMPVFTWMTLVVSFLLVFALPILTVGLVQLLFWREFGMPFFSADAGGGPPSVAAHLLAFWAPRGVHPDTAGHGNRLRDTADLFAKATVRLRHGCVRGRGHRIHGVHRLGAPHVHGGAGV